MYDMSIIDPDPPSTRVQKTVNTKEEVNAEISENLARIRKELADLYRKGGHMLNFRAKSAMEEALKLCGTAQCCIEDGVL